jgi:hypothetical protein
VTAGYSVTDTWQGASTGSPTFQQPPPFEPPPLPATALLLPPLQKYIDLVAEGNADWEGHEAFENYKEEEA